LRIQDHEGFSRRSLDIPLDFRKTHSGSSGRSIGESRTGGSEITVILARDSEVLRSER
jgi:hypothetical protein